MQNHYASKKFVEIICFFTINKVVLKKVFLFILFLQTSLVFAQVFDKKYETQQFPLEIFDMRKDLQNSLSKPTHSNKLKSANVILFDLNNSCTKEIEKFLGCGGDLDFFDDYYKNLPIPFIPPTEIIPTVSGELSVSATGGLNYTVPLDVPPGVNNFQPNLSFVYSSDAGMGLAGYGWSLSGLSGITRGGKSFAVDGLNQGVQYDDTDAWYLDGQRLVPESATIFRTQNYSQIKIEKTATGFIVSYPDGKQAEYVDAYAEATDAVYKNNNFVIKKMTDAFGNAVNYEYKKPGDATKGEQNAVVLTRISYGSATSPNLITLDFISKQKAFDDVFLPPRSKVYFRPNLYRSAGNQRRQKPVPTVQFLLRTYFKSQRNTNESRSAKWGGKNVEAVGV